MNNSESKKRKQETYKECDDFTQFQKCLQQINSKQNDCEIASSTELERISYILKIITLLLVSITITIVFAKLSFRKSHLTGAKVNRDISHQLIKPALAQEKKSDPQISTIKAVAALGRIEPLGKMIEVSPPPDLGGAKVARLLVKPGDRLTQGQTIALLDNHKRVRAATSLARQEVKVAQADLAIVQAGAKKGDIKARSANLLRLTSELAGETMASNAEIERLKAELATGKVEKKAVLDRRRAEFNNVKSELQRYQQLAQEGVISESELDTRRVAVDTAQQAVVEAQASYLATNQILQKQIHQTQAIADKNKGTLQEQIIEAEAALDSIREIREVDLIKAQATVDRAIASFNEAEENLQLTYVKAPTEGQVIEINTYPGELVGDEGVIAFGQTNKMIVIAETHESDISKIQVGQKAFITSESKAFDREISGTVQEIGLKIGKQSALATDPAADVDNRVVEVKIYLDRKTSKLISHLTNSKVMVKIKL